MPLIPPANYRFDIPDPAAQMRSNLEFATGLLGAQQKAALAPLEQQQAQAQAQAAQLQLTQAQLQAQHQQQMQDDLTALSKNPTPENIATTALRYPSLSKEILAAHGVLDATEQKARLGQMMQWQNAIYSGRPDLAAKGIETLAQAKENSGFKDQADQLRSIGEAVKADPRKGAAAIGLYLAPTMGADKFLETFKQFSQSPEEQRKQAADAEPAATSAGFEAGNKPAQLAATLAQTQAQTANANNEIANRDKTQALAEKKFGLEKDKNQAEIDKIRNEIGTLPEKVGEKVDALTDAAAKSQMMANRARNLAGVIGRKMTGPGAAGYGATIGEALKKATGSEDAYTGIRQQTADLLNSELIAGLPPGRMPPALLELKQRGFPEATASRSLLVPALNRIAEAHDLQAKLALAQKQWLSANRSTAPATKAFTIGGREVQPGETFESFIEPLLSTAAQAPKAAAAPDATNAPAPTASAAAPAATTPAGGLTTTARWTPQQIAKAVYYVRASRGHPDADPAKVAAISTKLAQLGVKI